MTKTNTTLNLIDAVTLNIRAVYSEEEADNFYATKDLASVINEPDEVQRGIINRVLIRKLLVHRADHEVSVVDPIFCLIPDGDNGSWMNVFKLVILPFLKSNQVKL